MTAEVRSHSTTIAEELERFLAKTPPYHRPREWYRLLKKALRCGVFFSDELSPASLELFMKTVPQVVAKFIEAERKHAWHDAWQDKITEAVWRASLYAHLEKGDVRDVIILGLIGLWHGWRTTKKTAADKEKVRR